MREGEEAALRTIPEGLRQLILRWIEMLSVEAQCLLQAVSVAGDVFVSVRDFGQRILGG